MARLKKAVQDAVRFGCTKRALKREQGYPVGTPAPIYLDCECGHHLTMPIGQLRVQCVCGIEYDAMGWIIGKIA